MRRWTRPLPAEPDRAILSHVWTTSTCYKPREIERISQAHLSTVTGAKRPRRERISWLPSGPLSPGDALDAGRPDTRHLLRSPPCAVSYHHALLTDPLSASDRHA